MVETKKKKKGASELQIQIALVQWLKKAFPVQSEVLAHFNNSSASPYKQMWLKQAGVLAGQPDLFLASPVQIWMDRHEFFHGLFIELKNETGAAKAQQKEQLKRLARRGYVCAVARGLTEAQFWIETYLMRAETIVDGTFTLTQPRRTAHVWFRVV